MYHATRRAPRALVPTTTHIVRTCGCGPHRWRSARSGMPLAAALVLALRLGQVAPAVRAAVAVGEEEGSPGSACRRCASRRGSSRSSRLSRRQLGAGAAVAELLQDVRQVLARRRREERAVLPIRALAQPHAPAEHSRARRNRPCSPSGQRALEHSRGRREHFAGPLRRRCSRGAP